MAQNQGNNFLAAAEASRIWKLYGFSSPKDLVLEDLALAMGVLVVDGPLDGSDARLVRKGDRGLIRVKDSIPESGRKRFAVAHEIGHWVLHKNISQILACTSDDMVSVYKASPPEIEASHFASNLLMPESLFAERIKSSRPTERVLAALADEFQTSLTATAVRYVELRDDYCALVVSENGKVRWWRESKDFKGDFWITPGSKLSSGTIAASIFKGASKPARPMAVDRDAWIPDSKQIDSDTLYEEAIPLTRYNQVLSLLWLP